MDKKMGYMIGLCVSLGTALSIFIGGVIFDLFPGNKYTGVFWMLFMPVALYYMKDQNTRSRKDIMNMLASFTVGLVWGYISVVTTPVLKQMGEFPFALVEYFILMFFIMIVHGTLLNKTVFDQVPCVFIAFALSIASSTTMWWSGGMNSETFMPAPIEAPWNQLDLFIVYVIGCALLWLMETLCGLFVGTYLKKNGKPE